LGRFGTDVVLATNKFKPRKSTSHAAGKFSKDCLLLKQQLEHFTGRVAKDVILTEKQVELRKPAHHAAGEFSKHLALTC